MAYRKYKCIFHVPYQCFKNNSYANAKIYRTLPNTKHNNCCLLSLHRNWWFQKCVCVRERERERETRPHQIAETYAEIDIYIYILNESFQKKIIYMDVLIYKIGCQKKY